MVSRAKRGRAGAAAVVTSAPAPGPAVGDVIIAAVRPHTGGQALRRQGGGGVERNAVNNAELRTNAQNILSMIHEYRPKNTSLAYKPKQAEFQDFCRRKQYYDGDTVTEEKLLLFLVEDVANRPLKTKSPKVDSDVPREKTRLA